MCVKPTDSADSYQEEVKLGVISREAQGGLLQVSRREAGGEEEARSDP